MELLVPNLEQSEWKIISLDVGGIAPTTVVLDLVVDGLRQNLLLH